jgi:hypothetical protein
MGTVVTRGLVRSAALVGVGGFLLLMVGGCLIPFTAGVSVLLMVPCLAAWPYAALVGWRGHRTLPADDPERPWALAALASGSTGLGLVGMTLVLLAASILGGVVLGTLHPEWFRPSR